MKDLNMSAYESTPQSLTLHLNLSSPKKGPISLQNNGERKVWLLH